MGQSIYCLMLLSVSIFLELSSCYEPIEGNGNLNLFLERRLREARTELNRIVMDTNGFLVRRAKRDSQRPVVTFDKFIENNLEIDGEVYHFDNILVLNSEIIKRIDKQHLQHLVILCGDCLRTDFRRVTFVQVAKKHSNNMFIVIGMDDGFLNLFSTHLSELNHHHHHHHHHHHNYTLLQRIPPTKGNSIYPVDGKFFMESGHLFLYVIYTSVNGDPSESILFKLRNSYLDKEYSNILTHGSKSVATFSSGTSQIIIIAEAANREVFSQVLRFSNSKKKLERIQLLGTKRPRSVTHFRAFESNFVFVCEESSPSTIYWWNGGEFQKWLDIPFTYGSCLFSIKKVNDQTFFLNTLQNEATIYSLGWRHIREIVPVPRPVDDDQKIINLFISTGNITRLNIVGTLPKSIRFSMWDLSLLAPNLTVEEGRSAVVDRLTECLGKAEGNLGAIAKRINDTNELANHLIQLDQSLHFDDIKVLDHNSSVRMNNGSAERVDLSYVDGKSTTDNDIDELLVTSSKLIQSSIIDQVKVIFKSNLTIKNANLKLASAHRVNDRVLNRKDFIWLDGKQELEYLNASDVKTDHFQTGDLQGKQIDHFTLKHKLNNGEGLFLSSLNCKEIYSKMKKINDINLDQLVIKNHNKTIHGGKTFKIVEVHQLQDIGAKLQINNESHSQKNVVEDPSNGINSKSIKLEANTIIDNLLVQQVNGIDVDELINDIVLNNIESSIDSGLTFVNDMKVDILRGYLIQSSNSNSQSTNSARRSPILSKRQFSSENERAENPENDCVIEQEQQDDFEETGQRSRSIQQGFPRYNFGRDIHVKGHIKVNELICKNCKVVIRNQSFPISHVEKIFWTYNTKQNITVPTIINSSMTANEAIKATFINEQKLDCILDDRNDRSFKPKFIFKNVTAMGDILDSSDSSHDGLKAKQLSDSIVRSSATQYIKDKKNFNGGVSVNYLKADNFEQRSPSELLPRSMRKSTEKGEEDDRPHKFVVDGDLIVREDLDVIFYNDIDIESKMKLAAYNDQDCDLKRVEFKNLETNNIFTASLNGGSLETAINSSQSHSKIHRAELHTSDDLEPLNLHDVTYMNDINVHEHLPKVVNMTAKTLIKDRKIFESHPIITNNLNTERINNARITDIYKNALSRSKEQNIKQPARILHDSSFKSLYSEKVNGIDAARLIDVSSNGSINLSCDLLFKKLTVLGDVAIANSCNRSKEELNGQRHFQNLHIIGNVSWKEAENNKGKIWTMLNKAVTADKTQTISGSVIFNKDLTIKQVQHTNDKSIKNTNLTHIMKDSLMKNKDNQVVMGEKFFLNHVSCNSMTLTDNLLVDHINQENITEFNRTLVRKYSTDVVEGLKYFEKGFTAFSLKTEGGVDGILLDDIVLTNSKRVFPETVFENLEIVKNLDIKNYNSIDFNEFLKERFLISKEAHQVFNGSISFQDNVTLKGESLVGTLNNVSINSIVLTKGNSPAPVKVIEECKTFNEMLKMEGTIKTERFNYQNLHRLNECSALYDRPSILKGNIVFENDVELDNGFWAQSYCIEGININLTNAIEAFNTYTGYKLNDDESRN